MPARPADCDEVASTPSAGIGGWLRRLGPIELWLGPGAFPLYLPTATRVLKLGPDVVEYLGIGRRSAAGEGFLLGVKAFHFGGTQVLHDGLAVDTRDRTRRSYGDDLDALEDEGVTMTTLGAYQIYDARALQQ